MLSLDVIKFCAEEVTRQNDSPMHVAYMCEAWDYASQFWWQMSKNFCDWEIIILNLSKLVDPGTNDGANYRYVPVTFANENRIGYENIPNQMKSLCGFLRDGTIKSDAQMVYEEFERVHPFKDGNGRIGKILFNLVNGTISEPVFPTEPDWSK